VELMLDSWTSPGQPNRAQWTQCVQARTPADAKEEFSHGPDRWNGTPTEEGDDLHLYCHQWHHPRGMCPARPVSDVGSSDHVPKVAGLKRVLAELALGPEAHDHHQGADQCPVCSAHDHSRGSAECPRCSDLSEVGAATFSR